MEGRDRTDREWKGETGLTGNGKVTQDWSDKEWKDGTGLTWNKKVRQD